MVVTLPSLQGYEISDYGYQLGRAWGIGQAKLNNGVLLIVAPTEHKVRIEVGYGLEPILTDALSEVIIQNADAAQIPQRRFQRRRGGGRRCADPAIVAGHVGSGKARPRRPNSSRSQGDQGGGG